jgi:hypothetical protein
MMVGVVVFVVVLVVAVVSVMKGFKGVERVVVVRSAVRGLVFRNTFFRD